MEGSGSYLTETDGRTVSFTYRSFEQQQKNDVLLAHHHRYVERTSEDDINANERTKLIGKSDKQPRLATTGRKACIMLACLYLQFLTAGIISALGVIYVDLIRVFNSPHSEAALVQSLFMGITIGGGFIFSVIIQKYGTGIPVMIASLVAGLAYIGSIFATNVPTLIATVGVIAGGAMSINFLAPFVTVGWSFQGNQKTFLAVLTLGSTAGQMVFPYISQSLVDNFRWNGSLLILSAFILNGIPCGLLMHTSRHFFQKGQSNKTTVLASMKSCLTDYLFVFYLATVFLFSGLAPIEMWFIVDLAILKGLDRTLGTTLLSLLGVFGFIGRVIAAFLLRALQRVDAMVHLSYGFVFWGVGHYLVQYFNELWGLVLAVVVRGLSAGLSVAVLPGSMLELRGIDRYPQTVALGNLMGGTAQVLGGLLGGITVDITGGYEFIFTLGAVVFLVCGILIIMIWFLKKRQKKRDPERSTDQINNKTIKTDREPLIVKYEDTKHG